MTPADPHPPTTTEAMKPALLTDSEIVDWLDENCSYIGGGHGGTYSFFSPADVECGLFRVAVTAAARATRTP